MGIAALVGLQASRDAVAQDEAEERLPDLQGEVTRRQLDDLTALPALDGEDQLVRMRRDLARAMAKPLEERRWAMVLDLRKCVGCHSCTIACVASNKLPPNVVYRRVEAEHGGTYPNVSLRSRPRQCNHCDAPPCVETCPADATWKRADASVVIDYDRCIGCGLCVDACPYQARSLDLGGNYSDTMLGAASGESLVNRPAAYEQGPTLEYGKAWERRDDSPPLGKARKCHFCLHRLEAGRLPACAATCIGRATIFGDASDDASLVAELLAAHPTEVLLPQQGAEPRVHYIV